MCLWFRLARSALWLAECCVNIEVNCFTALQCVLNCVHFSSITQHFTCCHFINCSFSIMIVWLIANIDLSADWIGKQCEVMLRRQIKKRKGIWLIEKPVLIRKVNCRLFIDRLCKNDCATIQITNSMLHSDFKMLIRANHTHLVHCYTLVTQTLILVVKVGAVTHYRRDGGVLYFYTTWRDMTSRRQDDINMYMSTGRHGQICVV